MALSFHDKFLAEEREYQESLFEKYCHLKTDLDFFELAVSSVDEIMRDVVVDLVLAGLTWDELLP